MCPTSKKWIFQPGKQKELTFLFKPDTVSDNKYVDPEVFFAKKHRKRIKKRGYIGFFSKVITGGFVDSTRFYFHPPRVNQYRRLFYAPHPQIELIAFEKKQHLYFTKLHIYGIGVYNHKYIYTKSININLFKESIKTWNLFVDSNMEFKNEKIVKRKAQSNECFDSTLKAKFCREYGFITIDYKFDNGIEIKFELVEVE